MVDQGLRRWAAALAGAAAWGLLPAGWAQEPAPPPAAVPASAVPAAPAPPPAEPSSLFGPSPRWEGALGPVFGLSPEYAGGARTKLSVVPGFYLRYGRLSVSNTGAFVTRRNDDVIRGLGADVHFSENLRTNLSLRLDRGRSSSSSPALQGVDNVPTTVRARLAGTWHPPGGGWIGGWHETLALSSDLLGRGGGQTLDLTASHDERFRADLVWSYGFNLAAASGEYMRRYYGITPDESVRSGYPVFRPGAGWRDVNLTTGWRLEIDARWVAFWGAGAGRLLGPAARSPLTFKPGHWDLNGGIAWRF